MPERDADRLTELEIALAHAERLAEDLSELVREQAERTARLERQVAALTERLAAVEAGVVMPPAADQRPPHW